MQALSIHSENPGMEEDARACRGGQPRDKVKCTFCVLVLMFLVGSGRLQAQRGVDLGKWELMRNQQEHAAFSRAQRASELERDLERLRIPEYNLRLSRETAAFQKHIADMHQRHVNCKVCRVYVKQIRHFSKKIEQAMK
jgi:hypothetical protein